MSGNERLCRDVGIGEIVLGLAMLKRAKRASDIDPPVSSNVIMRWAYPFRGENPELGKDIHRELYARPGIRERPRPDAAIKFGSRVAKIAKIQRRYGWWT